MRGRNRRNIWNNDYWEFAKINVRNPTIDPGSSEKTPSRRNANKTTPQYIIFKLEKIKVKEKILIKSQKKKKKHLIYRGIKIRITSNFTSETMQTRREWTEIKCWEEKPQETRILFPVKLSFKSEENKDFLKQTNKKKPWRNLLPVGLPCLANLKRSSSERRKNNKSETSVYIKKEEYQRKNK